MSSFSVTQVRYVTAGSCDSSTTDRYECLRVSTYTRFENGMCKKVNNRGGVAHTKGDVRQQGVFLMGDLVKEVHIRGAHMSQVWL